MPQGIIPAPTLLNVFINDAPEATRNKVSLYADDSKLIGSTDSSVTRASIQEDLNLISISVRE